MLLRYLTLFTLLGLLTGCSTSSVFMPYPARALSYQQALTTGTIQPALEANKKLLNRKDALLALLEQGRMQQLAGDYAASKQSFTLALAKLDAIDQRATLSLSHTASQGTALVSNDNAIPYQSHDYERIFVHQFQALNYIALGDKEAALVEMRRAQFFQDKNRENVNDTNSQVLSDNALNEYQNRFSATNDLAQRVKSSRQNAYVLYLAGVLYESKKQFDDAYIDYKRALSIAPDNRFLQEDVARLAKQLNRVEDSKNLSKIKFTSPKVNEGTVVVLYEEGFVPAKKELFLPFPWPEAWYTVAFPYYGDTWQSPIALNIHAINSQVITDTQALAARALQDNLVPMLIRQTLRAQTKHKMQQEAQKQGGLALGLLVGAYNFLSENADLRSWLTLPRFAHIARFNLSVGEQSLSLNNGQTLKISVQNQRITLVRIVNINEHFYVASWPL